MNKSAIDCAWCDWAQATDRCRDISGRLNLMTAAACDARVASPIVPLIAWSTAVTVKTARLGLCHTLVDVLKAGAAWHESVIGYDDAGIWAGILAGEIGPEDLQDDAREWADDADDATRALAKAALALIAAAHATQRPGTHRPPHAG